MTKQTSSFRRRLGSFFMELAGASHHGAPRLEQSLREQSNRRARDSE